MIRRQVTGLRIIPTEFRHMTALQLFRLGWDTTDIAVSKNVAESSVYNWMAASREAERLSSGIPKPA